MIIIDPPSPFASKAEWRDFLAEMQKLLRDRPDDQDVKKTIELAKNELG